MTDLTSLTPSELWAAMTAEQKYGIAEIIQTERIFGPWREVHGNWYRGNPLGREASAVYVKREECWVSFPGTAIHKTADAAKAAADAVLRQAGAVLVGDANAPTD